VEEGKHDELIRKANGIYAEFFNCNRRVGRYLKLINYFPAIQFKFLLNPMAGRCCVNHYSVTRKILPTALIKKQTLKQKFVRGDRVVIYAIISYFTSPHTYSPAPQAESHADIRDISLETIYVII